MPDLNMSGLEKAKYVLFGKAQQNAANYVWQDREVRFDCPATALDCRPGESVIDTLVSCTKRKLCSLLWAFHSPPCQLAEPH